MKTKSLILLIFFFCNVLIVCGQSNIDYKTEKKILRQKIKNQFKALKIGDTIQVPYSTSYGDDKTKRTFLTVYTAYSDNENYKCVIKGVIVAKNKREKGYNLIYKVLSISQCGDYPIVYDQKEIEIGQLLTHNMRYFKVLKNTAANSRLAK